MRFLFTIGRLVVWDFTLFEIKDEAEEPDVIVVHHHEEDDNGEPDLFGKG